MFNTKCLSERKIRQGGRDIGLFVTLVIKVENNVFESLAYQIYGLLLNLSSILVG